MAEILPDLSHNCANRFPIGERYGPKGLFDDRKEVINWEGGTLSGDDTSVEKPYSNPQLVEEMGYFWSGNHHKVMISIDLVAL